MFEKTAPHSIINVRALAQQMGTDPEETRVVAERFFASLAGAEGDLSEALIAASHGSQVKPKQVKSILDHLASDLCHPLPDTAETLSERVADLAGGARSHLSTLADRVTTGVASIDVAELRKDGAQKLAELRDRAAEIDAADIGQQIKGYGEKALEGARDLAEKIRPNAERADVPKLPQE